MSTHGIFISFFISCVLVSNSLQLTVRELDKVGSKGKSICGPAFCLELLFGPANVKHSFSTTPSSEFDDDDDSSNDWL